jgi:hypothetical protein
VRKDIDYAVPGFILKKHKADKEKTELVKSIMDAYTKASMQDMSLKEAQIEFLTILSQDEVMFASYYKVEKLNQLHSTISDPLMLGTARGKRGQLHKNILRSSTTDNKFEPIVRDSSDESVTESISNQDSTPDSEEDGDLSDSFELNI